MVQLAKNGVLGDRACLLRSSRIREANATSGELEPTGYAPTASSTMGTIRANDKLKANGNAAPGSHCCSRDEPDDRHQL